MLLANLRGRLCADACAGRKLGPCLHGFARLTDYLERFKYPNEIGPGVYDSHSPNTPTQEHMVQLMRKAVKRILAERLWVNRDCDLKTRQWAEVIPALTQVVAAAKTLRATTVA